MDTGEQGTQTGRLDKSSEMDIIHCNKTFKSANCSLSGGQPEGSFALNLDPHLFEVGFFFERVIPFHGDMSCS